MYSLDVQAPGVALQLELDPISGCAGRAGGTTSTCAARPIRASRRSTASSRPWPARRPRPGAVLTGRRAGHAAHAAGMRALDRDGRTRAGQRLGLACIKGAWHLLCTRSPGVRACRGSAAGRPSRRSRRARSVPVRWSAWISPTLVAVTYSVGPSKMQLVACSSSEISSSTSPSGDSTVTPPEIVVHDEQPAVRGERHAVRHVAVAQLAERGRPGRRRAGTRGAPSTPSSTCRPWASNAIPLG